eukprot:RCo030651
MNRFGQPHSLSTMAGLPAHAVFSQAPRGLSGGPQAHSPQPPIAADLSGVEGVLEATAVALANPNIAVPHATLARLQAHFQQCLLLVNARLQGGMQPAASDAAMSATIVLSNSLPSDPSMSSIAGSLEQEYHLLTQEDALLRAAQGGTWTPGTEDSASTVTLTGVSLHALRVLAQHNVVVGRRVSA